MGAFVEVIRRDWKNPPNIITAIRMIGILWLPSLALSRSEKRRLAAVVLFVTMASTDKLDGWLARNIYGTTTLGKLLDPVADKELLLVTLGSLIVDARRRRDTSLLRAIVGAAAVISFRELAVFAVKLHAQQRDHVVESAIQSSRITMVIQSVALASLLIPSNNKTVRRGKFVLLGVTVAASLYSGWDYYRRYR